MRKIWMLLLSLLVAATFAVAQDQDKDKDKDKGVKHDMKAAGHDTSEAAKKAARATKKGAMKVGHETKKGAIAARNKVTGDRDDDRDAAERQEGTAQEERGESAAEERREQEARAARARRNSANGSALPQSEGSEVGETARQEALERSVQIVSGPEIATTGSSATLRWTTNKTAATDVWLEGGGIRGHRTRYERGGARSHSVTFTGLRPNTTYTYMIRTREGEVRKEGTLTTR
jgi:hypothetical protein